MKLFKKYYTCTSCGKAICGTKRTFFACPMCGNAVSKKKEIKDFDDKYCTNCGYDLSSAIKKAKALLKEEEIN